MDLQLKVTLLGTAKPKVWRRITVPYTWTFWQLHLVLQLCFAWKDSHMYEFYSVDAKHQRDGKFLISFLDYIDDETEEGAAFMQDLNCKLSEVYNLKKRPPKLIYHYDFGDDWLHLVEAEAVLFTNARDPHCLAGAGAPLIEDVGGTAGYYDMLRKLSLDPQDEDAQEIRRWLGFAADKTYDPKRFDLAHTDANLRLWLCYADLENRRMDLGAYPWLQERLARLNPQLAEGRGLSLDLDEVYEDEDGAEEQPGEAAAPAEKKQETPLSADQVPQ